MLGFRPQFSIKYLMTLVARAVDSSQLEGNIAVLMGKLSVCPSTRTWFGSRANRPPIRLRTTLASSVRFALPSSKRTRSAKRMTMPRSSMTMYTSPSKSCWAAQFCKVSKMSCSCLISCMLGCMMTCSKSISKAASSTRSS